MGTEKRLLPDVEIIDDFMEQVTFEDIAEGRGGREGPGILGKGTACRKTEVKVSLGTIIQSPCGQSTIGGD